MFNFGWGTPILRRAHIANGPFPVSCSMCIVVASAVLLCQAKAEANIEHQLSVVRGEGLTAHVFTHRFQFDYDDLLFGAYGLQI